jgi:hypothetical protein
MLALHRFRQDNVLAAQPVEVQLTEARVGANVSIFKFY